MDALQEAFVIEARELIAQLEDGLMALEKAPDDELLHAVFRSAHTLKGAAATANCAMIAEFTHTLENTLDALRLHNRLLEPGLIEALLASVDHLHVLLEEFAKGQEMSSTQNSDAGARLLAQLDSAEESATSAIPTPGCNSCWHISARFNRDLYRQGQDPLALLEALEKIGRIEQLQTHFEQFDTLDHADPEDCLFTFEIRFNSHASKEEIERIFLFSVDEGQLHLIPPHAQSAEYVALIQSMPDNPMRLGEMLQQVGAITQAELETALNSKKENERIGAVLIAQGAAEPGVIAAAVEQQQTVKERLGREANLIKVPADKLDHLINLVGELVIASAGANMIATACAQAAIMESLQGMGRLTEAIRDSAMQLRMVPIGELFHRYQRIVRDAGKNLGKEIDLALEGTETELDKSLVEKLADPLLHLVRNAVDHGIESAEQREACGKPRAGRIKLAAWHDSGSVWIEIADNGRGLDEEKIRAKAIAAGLMGEDDHLSDHAIYNFIFEPGFSTVDQVTALSGRGVGMDVVRRTIQSLRGEISIQSQAGQGAAFRIRVPLTLAIIDGFLLRVGAHGFVVPLDSVLECLEWREEFTIPGSDCFKLRGEALPCLRLANLFDLDTPPAKRDNVVVVRSGNQRLGLVVDQLAGQCQTVIKPLGELFQPLKGIAGSTILGNGEVALIIDLQGLLELQTLRASGTAPPRLALDNNAQLTQ